MGGSKDIPMTAPNRICLRGSGRQFAGVDRQNFICLACSVARLIEEVQPIIYLGSDRFNLTIGLDFEFAEDVAGVGGEVSIGG